LDKQYNAKQEWKQYLVKSDHDHNFMHQADSLKKKEEGRFNIGKIKYSETAL